VVVVGGLEKTGILHLIRTHRRLDDDEIEFATQRARERVGGIVRVRTCARGERGDDRHCQNKIDETQYIFGELNCVLKPWYEYQ
jgi:hypothetical protein